MGAGERAVQVQIGAGEHAVAGDVGAQQMGQPGLGVARQQHLQRGLGVLGPAVQRQRPAPVGAEPGVERNGQPLAAERGQPVQHGLRLAHRQRADHHPRRAGFQQRLDILAPAHAAAGLHLQPGLRGDLPQQRTQGIAAGAGGVEIDQMQPTCASLRVARRKRQRIVAVAGFVQIVALLEPHHPAGADVDGGIDGKAHIGFHCRKLSSRRAPTAAERSGWNCAPATLPRATSAAKRSPCAQAATQSSVTGAA